MCLEFNCKKNLNCNKMTSFPIGIERKYNYSLKHQQSALDTYVTTTNTVGVFNNMYRPFYKSLKAPFILPCTGKHTKTKYFSPLYINGRFQEPQMTSQQQVIANNPEVDRFISPNDTSVFRPKTGYSNDSAGCSYLNSTRVTKTQVNAIRAPSLFFPAVATDKSILNGPNSVPRDPTTGEVLPASKDVVLFKDNYSVLSILSILNDITYNATNQFGNPIDKLNKAFNFFAPPLTVACCPITIQFTENGEYFFERRYPKNILEQVENVPDSTNPVLQNNLCFNRIIKQSNYDYSTFKLK